MKIRYLLYPFTVLILSLVAIVTAFEDPMLLVQENWLITPVAILAAALANATAVGGGFLFVPLFIYGYGLAPVVALKLSLATQAFGMSAGAAGWGRALLDPLCVLVAGTASLAGMALGTLLLQVPGSLVKPIFGWVSLLIFAAVVLEMRFGSNARALRIRSLDVRLVGLAAVSLIGGLMTSWTAIAVGELVAIYLLFVYRMRIETAIANGVLILALCSIAGLAMHTYLGGIPWHYLAFTVPGVLLGGYFGAMAGRAIEHQMWRRQDAGQTSLNFSPIKVLFAAIILIDGLSILVHSSLIE